MRKRLHDLQIISNNDKHSDRRQGLVIVVVLWVLVILATLVLAMARNTRLDNAVRITHGENVTARWLARAGIYKGIQIISDDNPANDALFERWHDNTSMFEAIKLGEGTYSITAVRPDENKTIYGLEDEAAKLNVNVATREMLMKLPEMTLSMAEAIIEHRARKTSTAESETQSNESDRTDSSYPAYRSIRTLRELAAITELDEEILYGEDTNLNGILETNENDGDRLPPDDNQDNTLQFGLLAYLTVYSFEYNRDAEQAPRLNINTASQSELETALEIVPPHAKWIVENRPFNDSIAELLEDGDKPTVPAEDKTDKNISALRMTLENETLAKETKKKIIPAIRPDRATFVRIADKITIDNDNRIAGRININTAGKTVLQTLPEISEPVAETIINDRLQRSDGFESIADLLSVPEMTVPVFKQIAPWITVRSNVFTIRSTATADRTGIRHSVEAVVMRGETTPVILYWKESGQ